jgi:predicted phosphodiesterase
MRLILSDPHLNDLVRDEYRHKFFTRLPDLARKHKVDEVMILGDITDQKDRHPARLVNRIVDHLFALAAPVRQVTILQGNHDYLNPEWPFFGFINKIPNVRWINVVQSRGDDLYLPHTSNHVKSWSPENVQMEGWDYIFAHNTFAGAVSEAGFKMVDGIPLDVFPRGAKVISGDVHVPQKLGCVTYVGAPYTINFGDQFEPRVLLLDKELRSLPVEGPRKRLLEVTAGGKLTKPIGASEGDMLKIRVRLNFEQAAKWWEFRQATYKWGEKYGLVVENVEPILQVDVNRTHILTTRGAQHKSDADLLRAYAKRFGVDDLTLQVGLKLLEPEE